MLLDLRDQARPVAAELAPTVGEPDADLVPMARATWLGRMINEHRSNAVFEGLAEQLARAGFDAAEVDEVRAFAAEERRHGVLCGAVVEALGGEAVAEIDAPEEFPVHADASALEGVLRNLLSVSCLSETVAVSLIAAERIEMAAEGASPALHDLLTRIWSDEIGHARFGWRVVAREVRNLDAAARARLATYLRVAFAHLEAHELAHLNPAAAPPAAGAAIGLCHGGDARELFYDTVEHVIIARLEALGIAAREAWATRASSGLHAAAA